MRAPCRGSVCGTLARRMQFVRTMNRILDELTGVAGAAATVLFAPILRPKYSTWGATGAEAKEALPGDELVEGDVLQSTRAISIAKEPREVFRWLAQMGRGRGGMYSYRLLETPDVDHIVPGLQHIEPGDFIYGAGRTWRVIDAKFPEHLVLSTGMSSWTFVLRALDGGRGTRLIVRNRLPAHGVGWKHLIDPASFVFERRMLLGLRARAEQN